MKYGDLTLGQIEAVANKLGGMEGVQRFLRGELTVKEQDLLRRVTTVPVSGAKKFVAKDHLATANVGWTGNNFNKLFLNKIEENVGEVVVAFHHLEKDSLDALILAELGNRAELNLAHLFGLIAKQSKGESGQLLTNGYANIAYVRDPEGNFWAVGASWYSDDGCWLVGARSVGDPVRWGDGCQILSRDS